MSVTHEARPGYGILERAASAISIQGIQPGHIPGTKPTKIRPSDWAIAVSLAGLGNEIGRLGFWAKWAGCEKSKERLAVLLAESGKGRAPGENIPRLAAMAAHDYCEGPLSARQVCRALKISRTQTWPKLKSAYRNMLEVVYRSEANLAREVRKTMY